VANSRAQQSRAAEKVHETQEQSWATPALLDTTSIPAREGYTQRWVRTKVKGEDDQNNVYRKINQGWKPRLLSSVPKGSFVPNLDFQGSEVIGIQGNILMERPIKQHQSQGQYHRKAIRNQMTAVRENMFNVHQSGEGMYAPTMRDSSDVSTGYRPDVADD
jgi:hypothetical protein